MACSCRLLMHTVDSRSVIKNSKVMGIVLLIYRTFVTTALPNIQYNCYVYFNTRIIPIAKTNWFYRTPLYNY